MLTSDAPTNTALPVRFSDKGYASTAVGSYNTPTRHRAVALVPVSGTSFKLAAACGQQLSEFREGHDEMRSCHRCFPA